MNKSSFLESLFNELKYNNFNYFVFGEYESLPVSTGSSDLDIAILYEERDRVKHIINDLIIEQKLIIVSYFENKNAYFYRIFSPQKQWGLQLDVFFKSFHIFGKQYYPKPLINNNIITHNNINVLDINEAYLVGFFKEIVHKAWAKDKYISGAIAQIESNRQLYTDYFTEFYGHEITQYLFNNLNYKALSKIGGQLNKLIMQRLFGKIFHGRRMILEKLTNINRLFLKPGYTIAFLGTDGSGKSTIIDRITPILNQAFHNTVYYEHLRPNVLPSIAKLLKKGDGFEGPNTNPHGNSQSGFLGSLFRFSYYFIDYTFGYFIKVFPKRSFTSCVWIFDRYYYDYLIDQKRARIKLPNWIIKFGEILLPKPDLIICLGTNPEQMHKRKPEITLEEVIRQVNVLKRLSSKNKRAHWIDTGGDIETSVDACLNVVINYMEDRFRNKLR